MAMNDDSMVRIMESLGLDYGPAERATKAFESRIASLNKQLFDLKANAIKGAGDINKMFSSQLGSMSGSKMILDQYGQPLKILNDNTASSFSKATDAANKHAHAVHGVAQEYNVFASEWQRRSQWFLSGTLFYGTLRAASETAQTISEVEMGVTEIARVMEDETFVFKDYRDELLQFGVDYGQTFNTVQDIALRWAQAGYNVKDSLENTKTSLLALNVAELDAQNATESLIGIMAQWQMTSKDLPLVLDKINKTADDFTVTSQDLVDGLLRSSGAAKIMGLSLDQTISLLTVMREASGRTGREVGNALNSILSYVQRPGSIKVLEGLGIQVFADKARTQFRNVMLTFQDIAANWGKMSADIQDGFVKAADDAGLYSEELASAVGVQEEWNDLQQRDISQAAAGVYRRNYFIGMIERLSGAQEVLNNMTDAAGYSQAENARTMETLEKKYTSLKAAAQELAVALGDAGLLDALKGATDLAKDAADSFADLDDETKALVLTALELVAAVTALKSVMGLFTAKNLIFGAEALLPGWTKLIPLILGAIGAISLYSYNSSIATAQSIEDSLKSAEAKQKDVEQADNLIKKYEELEGKAVKNNEVKSEMLDIQRQLASIYPDYVDGLDSEGNKLVTNIPLLREMNALKAQELELKKQEIMMEARNKLPQLDAEQQRLQKIIDTNRARLASGDTKRTYRKGRDIVTFDDASRIRQELIDALQQKAASEFEEESMKSILKDEFGYGSYDPYSDTLSGKDRYRSGLAGGGGTPMGGGMPLPATFTEESLKALYQANKLSIGTYLDGLRKLVKDNYSEFVGKTSQELNAMLNNPTTAEKTKEYLSLEQEIDSVTKQSSKSLKEKNEALQEELRLLQHKNALNQITLQDEIASLKHIRDTFLMNGEERMDIEERIYSTEQALIKETEQTLEKSLDKQRWLREREAQEYKDTLKSLQDDIKDAYDERIDLIDKEKDARIKALEEELKLLDRQEEEHDFDKNIADMQEQEAYWSVRTGEEARKKLADIRKEIAEAEHDRDIELQKQSLEDEIDAIEDAAEEEKEKWKAAYKQMEKAFEDHNLDIIAQAATYSKEAYQQWYDNYIKPMQEALNNGDAEGFGNAAGNVPSHEYGMSNEDYERFIANGTAWYGASAEQRAILQAENDAMRAKYGIPAGEYPAFHTGGETLSGGWAKVKPGEFFFPPDLSKDLKTLIAVSSGITGKVANSQSSTSYDKRKEVNLNGPLLNVENMHMEDEIDGEILSRQLNRAVLNLA